MALCLLPYASSKLLHRLSSTQHLSSRSSSFSNKSVRAKYRQEGSTSSEGRSDTQLGVSIDHVKLPNKEPCCRNTPLVILPKKPYRRSSRLRVRKGRQYEVKVEAEADLVNAEAEEWVNRVLANNAMVEIDPMTVVEQINAEKVAASPSKGIQVASLTTSSRVPDYFPPSNGGFPRISYNMAIAAGSAVVLAILVVLLQPGRKREVASAPGVSNQSENLQDAQLKGEFVGERVTKTMQKKSPVASAGKDGGARLPHREIIKGDKQFQPDGDEVANIRLRGVESAATAAILTKFDFQPNSLRSVLDYSSMPLPPSISKAGFKTDPHPQKASSPSSATFSKNNASVSKPRPTSKYDSVTPFFPSDRSPVSSNFKANSPAVEPVTPFFADEQGTKSYDTVTPFFADEVGQSSTSSKSVSSATATEQGTKSYENVTPFFTDEASQSSNSLGDQQEHEPEEAVTPFFKDEVKHSAATSSNSVALRGANEQGTKSYDTVIPFFGDDKVSQSAVTSAELAAPFSEGEQGTKSYKSVTPFFPDEVSQSNTSSASVAPISVDQQGKNSEAVTPFFEDEVNQTSNSSDSVALSDGNGQGTKPYDTVTPFFPSDLSPVSRSNPSPSLSPLGRSSKYESVTPFFPSDRSSVPKQHDLEESKADITPFFHNEQNIKSDDNVTPFFPSDLSPVSRSNPSPSPLGRSSKYESVTPFFPSDRSSVSKQHDLEESKADITPFFHNEQIMKSDDNVTPFFPSAFSPVSKASPSPSPLDRSSKYDSVTPFFPSDRSSVPKQHDLEESKADITPFFHNEQNMKSDDNVTPFFPSDLSPVSRSNPCPSPSPSPLGRSSKYESVTPFFPSDRSSVSKQHDLEESKADITPFFYNEQTMKSDDNVTPFFPSAFSPVSKASPSPSPLDRSSKYDSVTPFFPSDRSSVPKGHDLEVEDVTPFFPDEQMSKSYDNVTPFFADEINGADSGRLELEGQEEPSMPKELSREELALQAEEERASAKFRALQAAFPALAIGAGAVGAIAGVDGAFEMVGLTATASFISYELLWANTREALVEELSKITDHKKLFKFLQKRKIVKEC